VVGRTVSIYKIGIHHIIAVMQKVKRLSEKNERIPVPN